MKKLLLILSLIMCITFSYSQKTTDTLYIDEIYEDASKSLFSTKILEFDSISKQDLMNRFEAWGGQNFRNYSEVKTSKTENQITLMYIGGHFNVYSGMYIKLVSEFKDNKIRLSFYDDGNTYYYYPASKYQPGYKVESHKYKIKHYFNGFGSANPYLSYGNKIVYKTKDGYITKLFSRRVVLYALQYKKDIKNTIISIDKFLKIQTDANTDSDW